MGKKDKRKREEESAEETEEVAEESPVKKEKKKKKEKKDKKDKKEAPAASPRRSPRIAALKGEPVEDISLAAGEVGSAGAEAYRTENGITCCSEGALPDPIQLLDDAAKKLISAGLITAMSAKGFAAPTVIQAQVSPH